MKIKWLGHASFKISNEKIIYIDPYIVSENPEKADLILITHGHYDHCANVNKLKKKDTLILTTKKAKEKISEDVKVMKAGEEMKINDSTIKAVPAYNINKNYHPKGTGLGFVINIDEKKIYHAGDTDLIPEMKRLKNISVALLPIGGTYTMNLKEATQAAKLINPKIVVPMHYGKTKDINLPADPTKMKENLKDTDIRVEILEEKILQID